jgi:HlyD family secretion protein
MTIPFPTFRQHPEFAVNRKMLLALFVIAAAGCAKTETKAVVIPTATIQRRDVVVDAEATGVIEPINVIEVKSKTASGQVVKMPIEIGSQVRPGDLIVQLDTKDLLTAVEQSKADLSASKSNFDVASAALKRQQQLFNDRIITRPDLEAAQTQFANSQASLVRSTSADELARQRLTDATVNATVGGTIITKPVSLGQVIQAGGTSVNGGSVIATMADLSKVRSRALVNETDIGAVQAGQQATVTVDAYPDRPFRGIVEKIEPQATVQQNVTMFPVLISLDNSEGLLKPGMNGEVKVRTDERIGVIAVPNDAIRSVREARQAAGLLGLNPDSVAAQLKLNGGGFGGPGGGRGQGGPGGAGAPPAGGATKTQVSRGELALDFQGGFGQGGGRQGGFQMPDVTDADCKKVDDAMKKKPAIAKQIDDLRASMRDAADRSAVQAQMKTLYEKLGVDMMISGSCRRRNGGGGPSGAPAGAMGGGNGGGGQGFTRGGQGGAPSGSAQGGRGAGTANGSMTSGRQRARTGLVFVQKGTTWEPRIVRLGVANYDYTEVTDGLVEGDKVAMLSAAALQAKRQEQNDRMKSMTGSPLGGGASGGRTGGGRGN